jgi:hypothetical protein
VPDGGIQTGVSALIFGLLDGGCAGPGVKMFPSVFPSGEIGFLRADQQAQGIFYWTSKPGLAGDVRWPAWSPDGNKVVYGREAKPYARIGRQRH